MGEETIHKTIAPLDDKLAKINSESPVTLEEQSTMAVTFDSESLDLQMTTNVFQKLGKERENGGLIFWTTNW